MQVKELMTKDVETVRADDSMQRAAFLMSKRDVGCLPVVDKDRHLTGLVTDRDICLQASSKNQPMSTIAVLEAASRDAHTVSSHDTVAEAAEIMRRHQIRRLPVVDDDRRVVGILSLNDIARAGAARKWSSGEGLSSQEVGETLAAICEPKLGLERAAAV